MGGGSRNLLGTERNTIITQTTNPITLGMRKCIRKTQVVNNNTD